MKLSSSKQFILNHNLWGFSFIFLIVLYHYREDSIKNSEKRRRGKSKKWTILDKISLNQNVPVVLEHFCLSAINKTAFQAFYVEWLTTDYQHSKPVYLNTWLVSAGCASPNPRLKCTWVTQLSFSVCYMILEGSLPPRAHL